LSKFIDETEIVVKSGRGGKGVVSFRREKFVPKGGPDGGDGGKGGDIIFKVREEMRSLYNLKLKGVFKAEDGSPGKGRNKKGKDGKDCIIYVPSGTVIVEKKSGMILADLKEDSDEVLLLKGGKGGLGNARFATSTNRAPRYAQEGLPGKQLFLVVKLKIIADVGIVGLPNAGKSTLLAVLTKARPKIDSYPFTTLNPNLGIVNTGGSLRFIIADIPGLIEGASFGRGLGIQFLKHIERTKILLILLDLYNRDFKRHYEIVLKEMKSYSEELLKKPRLVVGSKIDIVPEEYILEFKKLDIEEKKICISSVANIGIEELKDEITNFLVNVKSPISNSLKTNKQL